MSMRAGRKGTPASLTSRTALSKPRRMKTQDGSYDADGRFQPRPKSPKWRKPAVEKRAAKEEDSSETKAGRNVIAAAAANWKTGQVPGEDKARLPLQMLHGPVSKQAVALGGPRVRYAADESVTSADPFPPVES